jgi:predicted TIM-barrel fold metal-dependent hydrolase
MKLEDMILVSVDDHLVEPPDMFEKVLSKKDLETAPRVIRENGQDVWVYGDRRFTNIAMNAVVGRPPEEYGFEPTSFGGMRQGCWDVHERIKDMNANGILGSLCFGSFCAIDGAGFLRHADKAEALKHLKAYNDWHIDHWCGAYPGRFIPVALVPLWDVNEIVKEIERVAAKGCRSITFPDNPSTKGLPSIHNPYWEPMWQACAANDIMINCHIGTGNAPPHPSAESPIEVWTITFPMAIAIAAADWLHLDAMKRLPLKMALTEGGIGWIPYLTERADFTNFRHGAWTNSNFGGKLPSEVFREHIYTCFVDDKFGLENLAKVGEDNVFYECDYPHSDSVWPESPEFLHRSVVEAGLTDLQINKITHLNAMRAMNYNPFEHFKRDDCTVGALRRKAVEQGVDVSPIRVDGAAKPLADDEAKRVVTSADVMKLFA